MKAAIKYVIDRFGPIAPVLIVLIPLYAVLELVGIFVFDLPPGSRAVVAIWFLCMLIIYIPLREWYYRTQKLWLPPDISPDGRSSSDIGVFRTVVLSMIVLLFAAILGAYEIIPIAYAFLGGVFVAAFLQSLELRKLAANA